MGERKKATSGANGGNHMGLDFRQNTAVTLHHESISFPRQPCAQLVE